ncbi:hypothetical protein FQN50_004359 [Emmonsiellopsis sp. PD_5]|nr:hypothetical protein FQN50_004359 [Emmonsiellopsis sp. PD_5]
MANLISSAASYARRLFTTDKEHPIIFLGLDGAGKTSLLYRLKTGEKVDTIPTVGFNGELAIKTGPGLTRSLYKESIVESVSAEGTNLRIWDIGGHVIIMSLGGRPSVLYHHYLQSDTAILFVVDAADTSRMSEALSDLEYVLKRAEAKHLAVAFNKRDHPRCKEYDFQDLVKQTREVIERNPTDFPCEIYDDLDELSAHTGAQTDLLLQKLVQVSKSKSPHPIDSTISTRTNAEILRRFAYTILREAKTTNRRRAAIIDETFPSIQSHIMRLRAQSPQTAEPYSMTQAYFWVQMLHAIIESLAPAGSGLDITKLSFDSFRILYPDLLPGDDAWKEFYSAETWNGVQGRMSVAVPDLKPLPNIVEQPDQTRIEDAAMSTLGEKWVNIPAHGSRPTTEDLLFKVRCAIKDSSDYPSLTHHTRMIHHAFDELLNTPPESRARGTSYASAAWYKVSFPPDKKAFTNIVFWSQLVLAAYSTMDQSFHHAAAEIRHEQCSYDSPKRNELFARFLESRPELCWEELWRLYFTEETWRRSVDFPSPYILPDRRGIPVYVEESVLKV